MTREPLPNRRMSESHDLRFQGMDVPRGCTVTGCQRPHKGRGYCNMHLKRIARSGSPLGQRTPDGEPQTFYREVVLRHDLDECLPWPYCTDQGGYGRLFREGRVQLVSRLVCMDVLGPAPTPDHYAIHSCGNGREGCVAKKHLRWGTAQDNAMDAIRHGRTNRGQRFYANKLTEVDVRSIRALRGIVTQTALAAQYGVSAGHIAGIQLGRTWAWLPQDEREAEIREEAA